MATQKMGKNFTFVIFWEDHGTHGAWIAGTLEAYVVVQGETVELAVKRLKDALYAYTVFDVSDGRDPWESVFREDLSMYTVDFAYKAKKAIAIELAGKYDKRLSYFGTFEVEPYKVLN